MTRRRSIAEARRILPSLVRDAENGYDIAVRDVDGEAARSTVAETTSQGGTAHSSTTDLADETAMNAAMASIEN